MTERQQIEQAIALQERLRGAVPDRVIDVTLAILREKLATVLFADLAGWTALADQILIEEAAIMPLNYTYLSVLLKPWLTMLHNGRFTHTKTPSSGRIKGRCPTCPPTCLTSCARRRSWQAATTD